MTNSIARTPIPAWVHDDPGALREAMLAAALQAPLPLLWEAYQTLTALPERLPANVLPLRLRPRRG